LNKDEPSSHLQPVLEFVCWAALEMQEEEQGKTFDPSMPFTLVSTDTLGFAGTSPRKGLKLTIFSV
jgi:hypothetical protein